MDVVNNTVRESVITRYEIENCGIYLDLVATDDFYQGETILILPTVTQPNPDKYSLEVSPGVHIDCSNDVSRAINHSCSPNAAVRNGRIIAWSCISMDDSITIDYNRTETKLFNPFDCGCGNRNCRGRIE